MKSVSMSRMSCYDLVKLLSSGLATPPMIICEGIALIFGVIMLFTGKLNLGRIRRQGSNVRIAGIVLMLPLAVGFLIGFYVGIQAIDKSAEWLQQSVLTLSIFELGGLVIAALVAAYLVSNAPETPVLAPSVPLTSNVLTVPEAAQYLRVTELEIQQLIDDGRLAAARIGGSYRIAKSALDDFLRQT
jgi:excisionase family DNA binding protein